MFSAQASLGPEEIVAPHDFGFQLSHYVIAPEVREADKLVEILRLSSGGLAKVDVVSRGTVETPRLELTISSPERLRRRRSQRPARSWHGAWPWTTTSGLSTPRLREIP